MRSKPPRGPKPKLGKSEAMLIAGSVRRHLELAVGSIAELEDRDGASALGFKSFGDLVASLLPQANLSPIAALAQKRVLRSFLPDDPVKPISAETLEFMASIHEADRARVWARAVDRSGESPPPLEILRVIQKSACAE